MIDPQQTLMVNIIKELRLSISTVMPLIDNNREHVSETATEIVDNFSNTIIEVAEHAIKMEKEAQLKEDDDKKIIDLRKLG